MQLLVGLPPRFIMNSRPLLASFLCASLASLAPAAAHAQLSPAGLSAAGQLATTLSWEAEPVNTSVLGLRSEDAKAGDDLTVALREAFAEREMAGGQEMSLEEVILTLDCSSEQDTECMTEAGRALESERLVYGTLGKDSNGYILDIIVLDVSMGQIDAQATLPLEGDSLKSGNLDATATEVVNSLYPKADPAVLAPASTGTIVDEGDDDIDDENDTPDSGLVWGPYKPRPAWKKAGLGVSVALVVAGAGVGIWGWVDGNRIQKDVVEPYIENPENNVVRGNQPLGPFCWEAVQGDRVNGKTAVEDPELATVCSKFNRRRIPYIVGLSTAVVAGISTATFLVLYFVHKRERPSDARRPQFRLSAGPTQGGGMVGGYGRF